MSTSETYIAASNTRSGSALDRVALHEPCDNCHQRPATDLWAESTLAVTHGAAQAWCRVCVLTAQLQNAERMAAALPELRRELKQALDGPAT